MAHRHLTGELEHRHSIDVEMEQVTALPAWRLPSGERMTDAAVLREQRLPRRLRCTAGAGAPTEDGGERHSSESQRATHSRQGYDGAAAHRQ